MAFNQAVPPSPVDSCWMDGESNHVISDTANGLAVVLGPLPNWDDEPSTSSRPTDGKSFCDKRRHIETPPKFYHNDPVQTEAGVRGDDRLLLFGSSSDLSVTGGGEPYLSASALRVGDERSNNINQGSTPGSPAISLPSKRLVMTNPSKHHCTAPEKAGTTTVTHVIRLHRTGSVEVEQVGRHESETKYEKNPLDTPDDRVVHDRTHSIAEENARHPPFANPPTEPTHSIENVGTLRSGPHITPVQHQYYMEEEKFWRERDVSHKSTLGVQNAGKPCGTESGHQMNTLERGTAMRDPVFTGGMGTSAAGVVNHGVDCNRAPNRNSGDLAGFTHVNATLGVGAHRRTALGYSANERSTANGNNDNCQQTISVLPDKNMPEEDRERHNIPYCATGISGPASVTATTARPHPQRENTRPSAVDEEQTGRLAIAARRRQEERRWARRRLTSLRDSEKLLAGVLEAMEEPGALPAGCSASVRWNGKLQDDMPDGTCPPETRVATLRQKLTNLFSDRRSSNVRSSERFHGQTCTCSYCSSLSPSKTRWSSRRLRRSTPRRRPDIATMGDTGRSAGQSPCPLPCTGFDGDFDDSESGFREAVGQRSTGVSAERQGQEMGHGHDEAKCAHRSSIGRGSAGDRKCFGGRSFGDDDDDDDDDDSCLEKKIANECLRKSRRELGQGIVKDGDAREVTFCSQSRGREDGRRKYLVGDVDEDDDTESDEGAAEIRVAGLSERIGLRCLQVEEECMRRERTVKRLFEEQLRGIRAGAQNTIRAAVGAERSRARKQSDEARKEAEEKEATMVAEAQSAEGRWNQEREALSMEASSAKSNLERQKRTFREAIDASQQEAKQALVNQKQALERGWAEERASLRRTAEDSQRRATEDRARAAKEATQQAHSRHGTLEAQVRSWKAKAEAAEKRALEERQRRRHLEAGAKGAFAEEVDKARKSQDRVLEDLRTKSEADREAHSQEVERLKEQHRNNLVRVHEEKKKLMNADREQWQRGMEEMREEATAKANEASNRAVAERSEALRRLRLAHDAEMRKAGRETLRLQREVRRLQDARSSEGVVSRARTADAPNGMPQSPLLRGSYSPNTLLSGAIETETTEGIPMA